MKKRLPEIDDIRGISIILMILIHTNAYFLSNSWAASTREISQYAVVAFLFCSAYLSLQKPYPASLTELWPYMIKRLKRLIIPFFIFFVTYVVFMNVAIGKHFSQKYIVESFLLTGGIDFNWLVLLFVQLMMITPLLQYLFAKKRKLFVLYSILAYVSSIVFLKFTPLPFYRSVMWLPWSLVIIYTFYFDRIWNDKKNFALVTLLLGLIFVGTQQFILLPLHHPLSMYNNKYPPNIYHIAYSLFIVNILYLSSQKKLFSSPPVQGVIHFFSINSYSLFFIHILVIEGVWKWIRPHNWILFFLFVTIISVAIQMGFNLFASKHKPMQAK